MTNFIPFVRVEINVFLDADAVEDGLDASKFISSVREAVEDAREKIVTSTSFETSAHIQIDSPLGTKFA